MNSQAIETLKAHYIEVRTDGENILVKDEWISPGLQPKHKWVNVTAWSQKQIMIWLGY